MVSIKEAKLMESNNNCQTIKKFKSFQLPKPTTFFEM